MRKFVVVLDQCELAVRMVEAGHQVRRPADSDPEQTLNQLDPEWQELWRRASTAALEYFAEQMANAQADPATRVQ